MPDPWLDHLPSHEREKIRKKMRSPEAYEKLRERVRGPEDLEREMRRNEQVAEFRFALESDPALRQSLKSEVQREWREQGMEAVVDAGKLSPEQRRALEKGNFTLTISAHPSTHQDQLMVLPEGAVQEKLPLKPAVSDRYIGQFLGQAGSGKRAA